MRLIASTRVTLMIQLIAVAHICGAVNSQKFPSSENDFERLGEEGVYVTTRAEPTTTASPATFLDGKVHHQSSKLGETTTDGYPILFSENDTYGKY